MLQERVLVLFEILKLLPPFLKEVEFSSGQLPGLL
jgi:hypothetical protein